MKVRLVSIVRPANVNGAVVTLIAPAERQKVVHKFELRPNEISTIDKVSFGLKVTLQIQIREIRNRSIVKMRLPVDSLYLRLGKSLVELALEKFRDSQTGNLAVSSNRLAAAIVVAI